MSDRPAPETGSEEVAPSFEESLKELERVVTQLERGDAPLEESLKLFEKGIELSEACRKQLEEAETRVEILLKRNGKVRAVPFQESEGAEGKKGSGTHARKPEGSGSPDSE